MIDLHLVAELAERRRGRRAAEAGADDDDLEPPLVRRVHELHVELVVVPLLGDGPVGDLGVEVVDRALTRQSTTPVERRAIGTLMFPTMMTTANPIAKQRRHGLKRGLLTRGSGTAPGAVVQVERRARGWRRCRRSPPAPARSWRSRLRYRSPRTKSGFAVPHVRSSRWKTRNSSDDDAGPAHRARREVGGDVVARATGSVAGRALRFMRGERVRGVDVEHERDDAAPIRSTHSDERCAGTAARAGRAATRRSG